MKKEHLDYLCGEAFREMVPLLAWRKQVIKPSWVDPPRPRASFGLVGEWVAVSDEVKGTFTKLLIPFRPDRVGWVKQDTLRLFRFDINKEKFHRVHAAVHHTKYPVVYATIDEPGFYGLIGLNTHPLILETIGLLCQLKPMMRALPAASRKSFHDRICEIILCAPDMQQFIHPRGKLVELENRLGLKSPDNVLAPLPRLAKRGETLCERCHGIDVIELPECHILEESLNLGPCAPAMWENVGPKHISGAMRQIVIDPSDHRRLYAVSANGGIWRLDNVDNYPNEVWQPLTDDRANLRFRTMAVAPSDGRVLYAATSVKELSVDPIRVYSKIYRSDTGGSGWERISQPSIGVVHRLVVHAANADVVFAASSTGLWRRSGENGVWTNLFADDCLDVALDPDDSSIIYLGVRARGVFKSSTTGGDWSPDPIIEYDPSSAGTTGFPSSPFREAVKIALGKRNADGSEQTPTTRTVAVRFGDDFCISHTSGEGGTDAWQRFPLGDVSGGSENRSDTDPIRQHEWCNCLAVDPFNPNHILTGGRRLFNSQGGESWDPASNLHVDQHNLTFDEDEDRQGLVYVANDGGVFSSLDAGWRWPKRLADTNMPQRRGLNLARGLITSEFRHSVVRGGRCLAAIDHSDCILSEDFDSWQFLLDDSDDTTQRLHEHTFIFPCPASLDRYYVFTPGAGLAQLDFARRSGFGDAPSLKQLSDRRVRLPKDADLSGYLPEDQIYLKHLPGPFAARFLAAEDERLLLFGAHRRNRFTIESLRIRTTDTTIAASEAETPAAIDAPFLAITFVPNDPDRAFAITATGELFERDFSEPGQFASVDRWRIPAGGNFVSRLIAVPGAVLRLYALSQHALGVFDDDARRWVTVLGSPPNSNESFMALASHPTRNGTLFLGTNRGVYLSEDGGRSLRPYRLGMPQVPVTELTFDEGYLYAATYGRGLWRCRPCPRK